MNILGVDYGRRFVGLALTSSSGSLSVVSPLDPLRVESFSNALENLSRVCPEYQISHLVFGLPYLKDGREGQLSKEIRRLARSLAKETNIKKVNFVDESLTSFAAGRTLVGIKKSRRREAENSLAAVLILEEFLSGLKRKRRKSEGF